MKLLAGVVALCCATAALAEHAVSRIAFGSCVMQTHAQPIWDVIAQQKPDLFLFIGDAIYADYDGKEAYAPTEETLKRDWGLLANEPHYRAFSSQVPIMATWDNHDYGKHDGGAEFELKELTKAYFLDFVGEPKQSATTQNAGHLRCKGVWTRRKTCTGDPARYPLVQGGGTQGQAQQGAEAGGGFDRLDGQIPAE